MSYILNLTKHNGKNGASRVQDLRRPFSNLNFPLILPPTDWRIVGKAIVMASACFGDRFAPPVALMLLTLLPRRAEDPHIVDMVVEMFTRKLRAFPLCVWDLTLMRGR